MVPKKARPLPVNHARRQAVENNIRAHFKTFFISEKKLLSDYVTKNLDPALLQKDASDKVDNVLNGYDWSTWTITVQATLQYLTEAFMNGADDAAYALQSELFNATDPRAIQYAEERIGELIGTGKNLNFALDATTRQDIHDSLVAALKEGPQSIENLAHVIQNSYSFSDWRCENIARTETGNAYNKGTLERFKTGNVAKVEVFDGEEHDDPCREANGAEWDLEYAMDHLLGHPSCVRAFAPIIDDSEVNNSE